MNNIRTYAFRVKRYASVAGRFHSPIFKRLQPLFSKIFSLFLGLINLLLRKKPLISEENTRSRRVKLLAWSIYYQAG